MPNDVTLGEVSRKLDDLSGDVKGLSTQLGERPSWRDLQALQDKLEERIAKLENQVTKLEDWQDWAVRVIIGTVISAIIAAYFIIKP